MGTTTASTTTANDYDYSYDPEEKEDAKDAEDAPASPAPEDEDIPTADAQDQDDTTQKDASPIIPIVIAVCLIILIGGLSIMFGLHYKRKLPACFYSIFSQRWKPVMNNDDFPQQDDEESKHPTIIKNGGLDDSVRVTQSKSMLIMISQL